MNNKSKQCPGKFSGNELKYISEYLDHEKQHDDSRSWTQRLEESFRDYMGVSHAISCNSGTSGLHMALAAAGVGKGDEVICPALTVVMDAYAILHMGAIPVFADVEEDTYNISPSDIERKITDKTKAIIVVSLEGLSVDMNPVMELADKHKLIVIEDTAQSLLAQYHGKYTGTIAHIGVYSFENKKHMTSGSEGGMVVTNDEDLAIKARKFGGIGYKHMTADAGRTSLALSTVQDPDYERFDTLGLNYRMAEACAAIGMAQFERIEEIVKFRCQSANIFSEAVKDCDWMVMQAVPEGYKHTYYTFSVDYRGKETIGIEWNEFYDKYVKMGGDGFYSACIVPYLEPVFRGKEYNGRRYDNNSCPVSEGLQKRIMQFKTNYRDMELAKRKADILFELINELK